MAHDESVNQNGGLHGWKNVDACNFEKTSYTLPLL